MQLIIVYYGLRRKKECLVISVVRNSGFARKNTEVYYGLIRQSAKERGFSDVSSQKLWVCTCKVAEHKRGEIFGFLELSG